MKLFFLGWTGKDLGLTAVPLELKKQGYEILYWTGLNLETEADQSQFPNAIFHDHFDALEGVSAPALINEKFDPPSEALLNQLTEMESVVLTMMNKHFEKMSVSERKHLYYHQVAYWLGVLQKLKPEAIIYSTIPHAVYDFVVYELAKILKIKNIMFEQTWVKDRMIWTFDFHKDFPFLKEKIFKNQGRNFTVKDLSDDFKEEYEIQNAKDKDATPVFTKDLRSKFSGFHLLGLKLKILIASFRDLSFFKKVIHFLKSRLGENPIKEYRGVQQKPDFAKPFIYFPLQYQPERTSSPQGGIFVDQLLMAETLASSLPDGWFLYIKEHPMQWRVRGWNFFSYRPPGFYKKIASFKNVKIVPIETNGYQLLNNSRAVATISGTSGWEAAARRKPVLLFGYAWYRACPGIFRINGIDSCRLALQKIAGGWSASAQAVINYLAALDQASFHGYVEAGGQKVSKLSPGQNAASILKAITTVL